MDKIYEAPKMPKIITKADLQNGDVLTTHSRVGNVPDIKDWLVLVVGGIKFGIELNREGLDKGGNWAQLRDKGVDFLELHRTMKPNRAAFRVANLLNFRKRMTKIWELPKPKATKADPKPKIKLGKVEYTEAELKKIVKEHAAIKKTVCPCKD